MQEAKKDQNTEIYGFTVGDRVTHVRDDGAEGIVTEIDSEYDLGDVTTCRVAWDVRSYEEAKLVPREDTDIQWTNKLALVA